MARAAARIIVVHACPEAAEIVRKHRAQQPSAQIVVITPTPSADLAAEMLEAGASACISREMADQIRRLATELVEPGLGLRWLDDLEGQS